MSEKVNDILKDNHYPSSCDSKTGDNKAFEGSETSLPPAKTNPFVGADGKLGVSTHNKAK